MEILSKPLSGDNFKAALRGLPGLTVAAGPRVRASRDKEFQWNESLDGTKEGVVAKDVVPEDLSLLRRLEGSRVPVIHLAH